MNGKVERSVPGVQGVLGEVRRGRNRGIVSALLRNSKERKFVSISVIVHVWLWVSDLGTVLPCLLSVWNIGHMNHLACFTHLGKLALHIIQLSLKCGSLISVLCSPANVYGLFCSREMCLASKCYTRYLDSENKSEFGKNFSFTIFLLNPTYCLIVDQRLSWFSRWFHYLCSK